MRDLNSVINVAVLEAIPLQPQVQCSTHVQMIALRQIAVRFGLYDAADYLRDRIEDTERRLAQRTPA